jgi:hypothetical protein
MRKVIKEVKENEYTYKLGYELYSNKVYPKMEIYNNEGLLSGGNWYSGSIEGLFYFDTNSSSYTYGDIGTIKEMFTKLRQYNEIPEYIEKEYEKIFLQYKNNNFKEF